MTPFSFEQDVWTPWRAGPTLSVSAMATSSAADKSVFECWFSDWCFDQLRVNRSGKYLSATVGISPQDPNHCSSEFKPPAHFHRKLAPPSGFYPESENAANCDEHSFRSCRKSPYQFQGPAFQPKNLGAPKMHFLLEQAVQKMRVCAGPGDTQTRRVTWRELPISAGLYGVMVGVQGGTCPYQQFYTV